MQFTIGDKIVHPHRGPGRIIDVEQRQTSDGAREYYVVKIPVYEMTLHVPVTTAAELGMRPAMSRTRVARVLDTLSSTPGQLSADYKERQASVWEKIKTGRPILTAEAVRDLTWRKRSAHLTKADSELLQRGQSFLAAEMALVSESEVAEAEDQIESALKAAMVAMEDNEQHKAIQVA